MRLNLKTSALVFSVGCTALVYGISYMPTEKAERRTDRAPSDISATFGSEDQTRSLRVHSRRASDGVRPLGVPETLLPPPLIMG